MKAETTKIIGEKFSEAIKADLSAEFAKCSFNKCDNDNSYPKAYHIDDISNKVYDTLLSRDFAVINTWNEYHGTEYTSTKEAVENPVTSESEMWLYLYALIDESGQCINVGVDIGGELPEELDNHYLLPISDRERDAITERFKELEIDKDLQSDYPEL